MNPIIEVRVSETTLCVGPLFLFIKSKNTLYPNVDKIKDAVSAWELAKETIAWNKLDYLERSIKTLNSITDKDYQNHLLTYYNNIYPLKPLSTYNQLLKTLNGRFYKFKRIFINRISKILYDLYSENNIIIS